MKTIEERAKEYIDPILAEGNDMYDDMLYSAFCDGVESEHAELTKWNSPEELPELDEDENARYVLLKFHSGDYTVGFYNHYQKYWSDEADNEVVIIGWRYIHE